MKKILRFLPVVALLAGVFGVATTKSDSIRADAAVTSADIRIAVVRPDWWKNDGAYQVLRLAPTTEDLTENVVDNITYVEIESYTADTYYAEGGGFTEYTTDGVVFYDIPLATITGMYFDLARLSTTDPAEATVLNNTGAELFNTTMLNKIWRIWGNGNGVFRPEGMDAESRKVSNGVINSLLYGYMTCSDSANNGYGAFDSLDTNFNLTGRTFSETDTVLDFINQSDYSLGRGAGVTVLTSDKIAMMQTMYNLSLSPARITTVDFKKNTKLVFLISLIGMSALAGFYFLKSKKQ